MRDERSRSSEVNTGPPPLENCSSMHICELRPVNKVSSIEILSE
jgi:hypothetical protein